MSEKINGGTLTRKPRVHDCPIPNIRTHGIRPADSWTCGECGSQWDCVGSNDPRDPEPYFMRKTSGYAVR